DTSGNVLERYVYDPYGAPTFLTSNYSTESGSAYAWNYLFQAGRYDAGTTNYNFRNRDYSPNLDRWLENDPLCFDGGQKNLYGAEGDNPVNVTDPSGLVGGILHHPYPLHLGGNPNPEVFFQMGSVAKPGQSHEKFTGDYRVCSVVQDKGVAN